MVKDEDIATDRPVSEQSKCRGDSLSRPLFLIRDEGEPVASPYTLFANVAWRMWLASAQFTTRQRFKIGDG